MTAKPSRYQRMRMNQIKKLLIKIEKAKERRKEKRKERKRKGRENQGSRKGKSKEGKMKEEPAHPLAISLPLTKENQESVIKQKTQKEEGEDIKKLEHQEGNVKDQSGKGNETESPTEKVVQPRVRKKLLPKLLAKLQKAKEKRRDKRREKRRKEQENQRHGKEIGQIGKNKQEFAFSSPLLSEDGKEAAVQQNLADKESQDNKELEERGRNAKNENKNKSGKKLVSEESREIPRNVKHLLTRNEVRNMRMERKQKRQNKEAKKRSRAVKKNEEKTLSGRAASDDATVEEQPNTLPGRIPVVLTNRPDSSDETPNSHEYKDAQQADNTLSSINRASLSPQSDFSERLDSGSARSIPVATQSTKDTSRHTSNKASRNVTSVGRYFVPTEGRPLMNDLINKSDDLSVNANGGRRFPLRMDRPLLSRFPGRPFGPQNYVQHPLQTNVHALIQRQASQILEQQRSRTNYVTYLMAQAQEAIRGQAFRALHVVARQMGYGTQQPGLLPFPNFSSAPQNQMNRWPSNQRYPFNGPFSRDNGWR